MQNKMLFIFCVLLLFIVPYSYAQTTQDNIQPDKSGYHESALRRAEIIFTSSIPFTAIHGYLSVRSVEMIRQRKVSPNMGKNDWTIVIGLTIAFSSFVTFWDWRQTHDKVISDRDLAPKDMIQTSFLDTKYQIDGLQIMNEPILASFYMEF